MATSIDVIYCGGGNKRFVEMATDAGMLYGAQLPDTIYTDVAPLHFADQNWKQPDRARYMSAIGQHRPRIASVIDWERDEQLQEVLSWAEEAAMHCEVVMIIPKVVGGVSKLPRRIGGKPIRLGYSVPTKHGATDVPAWEFAGWPVHLLGGQPHTQMELSHYFDVRSVDGNMFQKMAVRWCQFWQPGTARYAVNRWWPRLDEAGKAVGDDAPYEAFDRSARAIVAAWEALRER